MAEQVSLRGFTRIDALVAGTICLVLVLLAPVVLAMTQEHHFRNVCGANLAEIGKAMFVYAGDYEGNLPQAGGRNSGWGRLSNFAGVSRMQAFGLSADGSGGNATISSSFYLLVKYCQVPTRLFVCPGDEGTTEFTLAALTSGLLTTTQLEDLWDFGPGAVAYKSCSFSYHHPYSQYPLATARDPNLAVAADRNPWIKSPMADPAPAWEFRPDLIPGMDNPQAAQVGNAAAHQKDGQNVLFLDGRITFETRAYCGVGQDNIYTVSRDSTTGSAIGIIPFVVSQRPANDQDSYLVHDPEAFGSAGSSPKP